MKMASQERARAVYEKWRSNLGTMITDHIDDAIQSTESMVWALAAKRVSDCMAHYTGKMGDPSGCLQGLAAEFSANSRGDGPDND